MAVVDIINNGASLKIVTDGVANFITKYQIQQITIIKSSIIKLDLGRGALHNVFINFADVRNPLAANPEDLRDRINEMLLTSVAGNATEVKQDVEIGTLSDIREIINNMRMKLDTMGNSILDEPILVDESNPLTIYKGFANIRSKTSDPVWAIQRITNKGEINYYEWANGDRNFDNVWDNRLEYDYK